MLNLHQRIILANRTHDLAHKDDKTSLFKYRQCLGVKLALDWILVGLTLDQIKDKAFTQHRTYGMHTTIYHTILKVAHKHFTTFAKKA